MKPATLGLLFGILAILGVVTARAVLERDREALWASLPWPIKFTGENRLE